LLAVETSCAEAFLQLPFSSSPFLEHSFLYLAERSMAVSIKCTDVIRPYSGDTDCAEWIRKVELVAKLQSIDELEKFIPLFLVGGAFSVYEALSDEKKTDYEKLKAALLKAFSVNQTTAYEQFINRRLLPGETEGTTEW
jgi:hypothetical protein